MRRRLPVIAGRMAKDFFQNKKFYSILFHVAHMLLFICNLTITLRNMRLNLYVKI